MLHGAVMKAKWVKDRVADTEFRAFNYKIEGKTVDTRGLYVSINGYSAEAIRGMNSKGALRFVCIDGAHIMRAVE
jgi:restriction endonuclease Mrr